MSGKTGNDAQWCDKNGKMFGVGDVVVGPDGVSFMVGGGVVIPYAALAPLKFARAEEVTVAASGTTPDVVTPLGHGSGSIVWSGGPQ